MALQYHYNYLLLLQLKQAYFCLSSFLTIIYS
nr:MAG TPA: hypothetical protein [Bacteriophage sp.]